MNVDKISVIGGDLRIIKLAKMLAEDGNKVYTYGMEKFVLIKSLFLFILTLY